MKFQKSLMIGLMAVAGSLAPGVASSANLDASPGVKQLTSINQEKSPEYLKKQANSIVDGLKLSSLSSSFSNEYTTTDAESKKSLDFMKAIFKSQEVSSVFQHSPKKDSLIFSHNNDLGAFAFAYDSTCIVNVGTKDNGMAQKIPVSKHVGHDLSEKLDLNESDKELYNEFVTRHEISHCRFNDYANPLVVSKDSKLNSVANAVLRDTPTIVGAPISQMVDESYADSLAAIQMLVKYGVNDTKVNSILAKVHTNRESIAIDDHDLAAESVHDTHHGLKLILTKEYKDRISKLSSNDGPEMEKMALEVANKALVYKITQFDDYQSGLIFNIDNVKKATSDNIALQIYKESPQDFKRGLLGNVISTKIGSSETAITEIAKERIAEMKKEGTYDAYKQALVKLSFNLSDPDSGYASKMKFIADRNEAHDFIKKEEVKLGRVLDERIKEKVGFSATDIMSQIVGELKGYQFTSDVVQGKEKETIQTRASENFSPSNLKMLKLPQNMADKMDKIHQSIIQSGLPENITETKFKLK